MALDLWLRDDVQRILDALCRAASRAPESDYQNGYLDALSDAATAFGLKQQSQTPVLQSQVQVPTVHPWDTTGQPIPGWEFVMVDGRMIVRPIDLLGPR